MPSLDKRGSVWRLDIGDDENRFSMEWLAAIETFLDVVTAGGDPGVLVTVGSGKFFSNGLDLGWVETHADEFPAYVARVQRLLARILTFPMTTVAAINGHAFGAGAMFGLAHDYRVMRSDRGFFCLPEIDIGIPFSPGMSALVLAKVSPRQAVRVMTTGRRFTGPEAVQAALVESAVDLEELESAALGLVDGLAGKDQATLAAIKSTMFKTVLTALAEPFPV